MDANTGTVLSRQLKQMYEELNRMLDAVAVGCAPDEARWYRQQIGNIMSLMSLHIMQPIYDEHPELMPPEFR